MVELKAINSLLLGLKNVRGIRVNLALLITGMKEWHECANYWSKGREVIFEQIRHAHSFQVNLFQTLQCFAKHGLYLRCHSM